MPVVLLSGGLDSAVLLQWIRDQPSMLNVDPIEEIHALLFDCGNGTQKTLSDFCRRQCREADAILHVHDCRTLWPAGTLSASKAPKKKESPVEWTKRHKKDPYWKTVYDYQDGRGMMFLTVASILASRLGMKQVFVAHQLDPEDWEKIDSDEIEHLLLTDGSLQFVGAFEDLMRSGGFLPERTPRICVPFMDLRMSKTAIVRLGIQLNVNFKITHSCEYRSPPCGKCYCCRRRKRAMEQA